MQQNDKKTFGEILESMSELRIKEKIYKEMPKDKLVDRLILCEMELAAEKEESANRMELWYFVSDETGAKYLSDEKPKAYFTTSGQPKNTLPLTFKVKDGVIMDMPKTILLTDGEINIRVPKKMESMFPEIKYGDDPIKVILSNITL